MYFLYKLVCSSSFPNIYWQVFHVYFNRTEMLFCYWRLNYTFFSAVFQVRSEAFMEMWKWGLKKQGFYPDPFNTDHTSHQSTSSESAFSVRIILMIVLMNMYLYKNQIIQKHIFTFHNIYYILYHISFYYKSLERWLWAWLILGLITWSLNHGLSSHWNSFKKVIKQN